MINPFDSFRPQGVPGAKGVFLPNNYDFDLTIDTWWSAVQRARLYSEFTGLDALYSYVMKSSTLVRAAIDKRLNPLKQRTFAVMINGKENKELTKRFCQSALVRTLIYQKGLSNFTFARVVGVDKQGKVFIYPLRNLDFINEAVKEQTYDTQGTWKVSQHANLFWLQTDYSSEDTLGLLEPICRDYINACKSQNNWQTASQLLAYQQPVMYYENGDEEMKIAADKAATQVGLGSVIVTGKTTDEQSGKIIKDLELENVYSGGAADTFRIFKENLDSLYENIGLVILGSSLLMKSAKNTNSERLVRAHLKGFYDILETDAIGVQDWLNLAEQRKKLSIVLNMPELVNATIEVKPVAKIDLGDVETFVNMLSTLNMSPTETFINKVGLDQEDVVGYEDSKNAKPGSKVPEKVPADGHPKKSIASSIAGYARRLFAS